MVQCKLANEQQLKILEDRKEGFLEHYMGFRSCRFCTPKYLRDLLRNVFDNRAEKNPYLCIHVKDGTHPAGHIYEGVKITGWATEHKDGKAIETVGFTMGDCQYFHFKVTDIVMVQVI